MPLLQTLMNNTFVSVQAAKDVILKKSFPSFPTVQVMDKYFPLLHLQIRTLSMSLQSHIRM